LAFRPSRASAVTHVDVEQQAILLPAEQSPVQNPGMAQPDSDTVSPAHHPTDGPPGEVQNTVRPSEASTVASPPEHEGNLKYISKYLVQYVPVKQTKPSSSNCVTGARILASEECAQIIFEREEKREKRRRRKEKRERGERRRWPESRGKRERRNSQ